MRARVCVCACVCLRHKVTFAQNCENGRKLEWRCRWRNVHHLSVTVGGRQVLPAQQEHMDKHTTTPATPTAVSGPLWHVHNVYQLCQLVAETVGITGCVSAVPVQPLAHQPSA